MCVLSQELDTKAPPWTRPAGLSPAGGFPTPCGELFPLAGGLQLYFRIESYAC